ncbi:hypothetical protein T4D_7590 [Trichinella pseudospiralis]|uniref:Dilute domain-containing protein n=1 Tax=Trichinella pseudospiralis TaxID=6337 RepID=A0A0V1FBF1_TRIPS|nr:hypothetical protein T4D_7590 [Trichinella pseudospiralis]
MSLYGAKKIFQPPIQVANLLQARKAVPDVQGFDEICSPLNVSQIVDVLRKQTETGNELAIIQVNHVNANDILNFEPCDVNTKTAEIPKSV